MSTVLWYNKGVASIEAAKATVSVNFMGTAILDFMSAAILDFGGNSNKSPLGPLAIFHPGYSPILTN